VPPLQLQVLAQQQLLLQPALPALLDRLPELPQMLVLQQASGRQAQPRPAWWHRQ
jgi:hypothetical protein